MSEHVLIAVGVVILALVAAKVIDSIIARRQLTPEAATRYRVLRRVVASGIVFVGVLSALLLLPQVRAVAGAILASSAVIGLVVGFAAQKTLGNVIAGLLIALAQPVRLGDRVEVAGTTGTVEEIGLSYTWVRTTANDLLAIPNERFASETIRNSTIRARDRLAEVVVRVPAGVDLRRALAVLQTEASEAYVTDLAGGPTIAVRRRIAGGDLVDREESDLRVLVHERLSAAGMLA